MRFTLRSGPQEIEILSREDFLELHDVASTLEYLRQFLDDPVNRDVLRRSLAEGGMQVGAQRFEDEDPLVVLAHRLVSGELKGIRRRLDHPIQPPKEIPEATPRELETQSPPPATAVSSPPEAAPPPEVNQAAQAEALESAAESGAPLCET